MCLEETHPTSTLNHAALRCPSFPLESHWSGPYHPTSQPSFSHHPQLSEPIRKSSQQTITYTLTPLQTHLILHHTPMMPMLLLRMLFILLRLINQIHLTTLIAILLFVFSSAPAFSPSEGLSVHSSGRRDLRIGDTRSRSWCTSAKNR